MIQRHTDKSTETKSTSNQPSGKVYWQSLDQLLETPEANQVIDHDFGAAVPPSNDGFSRRRWLQVMGASMAFGAVSGCRNPNEKITPFAFRPQGRIPGVPDKYSTMMEFGGMALPLVALSYDGRPIKLDGNPDHPDSGGGSNVYTQASILSLYDPDRCRETTLTKEGVVSTKDWDEAIAALKPLMAQKGVAVLAEPSSSPSRRRLKKALLEANKETRWFEFTSVTSDNSRAGSKMAFGSVHQPFYKLADAEIIVCIDADPLGVDTAGVPLARGFSQSRDVDHGRMSRLYCVESDFSTTGGAADHRVALRFGQIGNFLAALEEALKKGPGEVDASLPNDNQKVLAAMASDLWQNKGAGVVMVGDTQPPEVHARAFRINSMLNNIGSTVQILKVEEPDEKPCVEQLKDLTQAIAEGKVETLLILGGNPVFYAPSDLKLDDAIKQVKNTAQLSVYRNETSRVCTWHLNAAHPLASWGDARSYDGSICISQPLIAPLFQGRSQIELLAELLGDSGHHDHEHEGEEGNQHVPDPEDVSVGLAVVKETLGPFLKGDNPESSWHDSVKNGFIAGSAIKPANPNLVEMNLTRSGEDWQTEWTSGEPELIFRPSKQIHDGRYANNGWLQEVPEFITKLTWDNAALVNPFTARELGLSQGKIANFKVDENQISLPVYVLPGLANGTICTWLGYGRTAAGRVAGDADVMVDSVGTDIRPLRTSGNWWSVPTVVTDPTSTSYLLATTQDHFQIDNLGRDEINKRVPSHLIRSGTWENYQAFQKKQAGEEHASDDHAADDHTADAHAAEDHAAEEHHDSHGHGHAKHWPEGHHLHFENFDLTRAGWLDEKVSHKWGMSIDLTKCTGCNACVISCQAENNIPVVGKEQVSKGREMSWLRLDRYFITEQGDRDGKNPTVASQPISCQQCEKAPCETVCPVAATVHSDEGLNDMVYNRCIGTRYCGNNCPFKVRRFNYFNYTDAQTFLKIPGADRLKKADLQLQGMVMNPEVTVRSRGVMEKCTYCVQKIQAAKIKAKTEGNRKLRPNEIKTACQDACGSDAIAFGDLLNEKSDVYKQHHNPRAYAMLEELNIYPRTKYLARVVNPHPAFVEDHGEVAH